MFFSFLLSSKGITLHFSVRSRRAHLQRLCVACKKGSIRAPPPSPLSVGEQLCAEQRATGPFSICVFNLPSFHTLTHIFTTQPTPRLPRLTPNFLNPSVGILLLDCLYLNFSRRCTKFCGSLSPPLFSSPGGIMQSSQKGAVSLQLRASLHSLQEASLSSPV